MLAALDIHELLAVNSLTANLSYVTIKWWINHRDPLYYKYVLLIVVILELKMVEK